MNLPASPQTYNELKSSLTRFIGSQATVALNRDGQSGLFIDPPGFSLADISKLEQAIGGPDLKSFLPGADTPAIALDFSRITLESLALIAGEDDQATQLTFTIAWDPGLTKSFKGPMAGARQKTQSDFALKEISVTFEMINHSYSAVLEARLVVEQVTLDVKVSLPGLIFEAQLLQFATLDDDGNIVAGSIEPIPKGDKLANRYLPASLVKMKQSPLKLQELRILIALRQERFIFFMVVDNLLSLEPFTLKRLQVEVVYAGSVSSELDVQLYGVVEIDLGPNTLPIIIGLGGEYSTSGGVKFYGRIGSQGIQVKEVIDAVAKSLQLSPPELPQILAGAKIVQLGFEYTSKPKKFTFSFAATFQFSKEEPPVDLRLNYFGDAGSMLLSGAVTIEGEEFDLAFERKKVPAGQQSAAPAQKETYMLGAFVSKDNAAVDLAGLVQNVSPQVAQAVPKVNLSIKDILFAYAQPANGRSTFLFALAVNLDLDLTQIQVVGDELKAYHPLGLSEIQAIYATDMLSAGSAAAFNDIFSKNQINVSLPLPAQDAAAISPTPAAPAPGSPGQVPPPVALNAGFNFGATLDLPAGKYPLLSGARNPAPPRPGDQSPVPAQTPPAAGSQASKLTPPSQSAALAAASNATWIEVQTQVGPVLIQRLGGRYANERIWLLLSGSLAVGPMTLDLQGMGVGFKLSAPPAPEFTLDGMGLAYSSGPLQITGIFLKTAANVYDNKGKKTKKTITQYAGEVRVQAETFSLLAVGAYGQLAGGEPTIFIYGAISAENGEGLTLGPLTITGLALGFGINRRVIAPTINTVSQFPLVSMIMGPSVPGGQPYKPAAQTEPGEVLGKLNDVLPPQPRQFFGAIGLRFSIFETIDCFALAIVQGGRMLEISIVGIGRFKKPDEADRKPLCYIELDILIDIKPDSGIFKAEALLANSWVLDQNCQITGGFALYIWFGGPHKGDFVLTVGGYHPRFVKPTHYPAVPRLGLNWRISSILFIKGGIYFAITPSAFMAGGRLEASFHTSVIGADFIAYADFLIQWKPLYYDIALGISVRAYANLALFTIHVTLSVDLLIQGPPVHGKARLKIGPLHPTIEFGRKPEKPPYIKAWSEFGRSFLDRSSTQDKWMPPGSSKQPVPGPNLHQLNVVAGVKSTPKSKPAQPPVAGSGKPQPWLLRADEMVLSLTAVMPISELQIGTLKATGTQATGLPIPHANLNQDDKWTGHSFAVSTDLIFAGGAHKSYKSPAYGIRPMNRRQVTTVARVTIVREAVDQQKAAVDLSRWAAVPDQGGVPEALWSPNPAGSAPSAKTIPNSISGLRQFKPPVGGTLGQVIGPLQSKDFGWDDLKPHKVVRVDSRPERAAWPNTPQVEQQDLTLYKEYEEEMRKALTWAGFAEAIDFPAGAANPRPPYADPLGGSTADKHKQGVN